MRLSSEFQRTAFEVVFLLILISSLLTTLSIPISKAYEATGTIYIRTDGSVDPPTAPIQRNGEIYSFTDNIKLLSETAVYCLTVEKSNIVLDGNGCRLEGPSTDWRIPIGVYVHDVGNITIQNLTIIGFGRNICIDSSSNNTITRNDLLTDKGEWLEISSSFHNIITDNDMAMARLYSSSDNILSRNTIAGGYSDRYGNGYDALVLSGSSNNTIIENDIDVVYWSRGTLPNALILSSSSNNTIVENSIKAVQRDTVNDAIISTSSSNNTVYHNDMVGGVICDSSPNIWDDGYPSGGNYWSSYSSVDEYKGPYQNETGSDGIGDTPRLLAPNNTDHYPLMNPCFDYDTAIGDIEVIKTAVESGQATSINVTVLNKGKGPNTFGLAVRADYVYVGYKPHEIQASLLNNADQGWNYTIPGPTISTYQGDTLTLTLEAADSLHHLFYVDYNGNAFPDGGEPQSPSFINTNITFSFTTDTIGSFTYYCAYNQATMHGQIIVNPPPPSPQGPVQIGTVQITLAEKEVRTVTFVWNTTGLVKGDYVVSALAEIVPGEMNTADNSLTKGNVHVGIRDDVNGDGRVDVKDVYKVGLAYGTSLEGPNPPGRTYDPNCDINDDSKVNMRDYYPVCQHYGEVES